MRDEQNATKLEQIQIVSSNGLEAWNPEKLHETKVWGKTPGQNSKAPGIHAIGDRKYRGVAARGMTVPAGTTLTLGRAH